MSRPVAPLPELLDRLEAHYGAQSPAWPTDPYQFLVWWHCGYPASDAACAKGWAALTSTIGIEPRTLYDADTKSLAGALRPGGMVPELRAMRLKEIAARILDLRGEDLTSALRKYPLDEARALLKRFPNIADPGADRMLLFAGIAPVAAVPSNCPHVLVRIRKGPERENYGVNYRTAQQAIETGVPADAASRSRAYLLLKQHGQTQCKRTNPRCARCPVSDVCAYYGSSVSTRQS